MVDKKYDRNKFLIHDYFFAKTLDKVRPGGIVAFITSKGTLDKSNPEVRKYLHNGPSYLVLSGFQIKPLNRMQEQK